MKTLHWGSSNERWAHFHHEDDFSGYVTIVQPEKMAAVAIDVDPNFSDEPAVVSVRVPVKALMAFYRNYMRHQMSDFVESMTDREVDRFILSIMHKDLVEE